MLSFFFFFKGQQWEVGTVKGSFGDASVLLSCDALKAPGIWSRGHGESHRRGEAGTGATDRRAALCGTDRVTRFRPGSPLVTPQEGPRAAHTRQVTVAWAPLPLLVPPGVIATSLQTVCKVPGVKPFGSPDGGELGQGSGGDIAGPQACDSPDGGRSFC